MTRAWGLLLGFAADRAFGDPRHFHPVAGFGALAGVVERRWYADSRPRGAAYAAVLVGGATVAGVLVERCCTGRGAVRLAATAVTTWTVLGGRSLQREATAVGALLGDGDLVGARSRVTHLVGRDPSALDAGEVSRAVVESVAENTADAVVAPLVWGAVAGVPGLLAYRAANTLDAMVGHHTERHERFGWASARLDDVLNLPASRLTGLLTMAAKPGSAHAAWRAWRRDARAHPSPNAGIPEAAFAGALGVRLGGTNVYGEHTEHGSEPRAEHRALLGDGRRVNPADIGRATRLAVRVDILAMVVAAGLATLLGRREGHRS
jgi:adenosylcobinamide-phosphate synthase